MTSARAYLVALGTAIPALIVARPADATGPFDLTPKTQFADVNGDGKADAIAINNDGVFLRISTGYSFAPGYSNWTGGAFYGTRGTFFADVTGDNLADAIAINDDGIYVRPSTGSGFASASNWTGYPFYGDQPNTFRTYFADVDGDGKADALVVNSNGVSVRISTGSSFASDWNWTGGAFYGTRGTFFADVTGDGKADAIAVNDDGVFVRASTGSSFPGPAVKWTTGAFYGNAPSLFKSYPRPIRFFVRKVS